jgi:exonuclease SbcD
MPPQNQNEYIKKVVLSDEKGPVNFYLLPFLKPGYVRNLFGDSQPQGYEHAVKEVLARENIDTVERNVLLSHQFYAGGSSDPETCESEQAVIMAGGLDRVDVCVLPAFDYVALGHLHGPQRVSKDWIRYSGTPFKYSVSEEHHKKGITVIHMGEKGEALTYDVLPLRGIQDVRRERGTLKEVLDRADDTNCHDFISVTLTDEDEPYRIREQLKEVYDHMLELKVDNVRTRERMMEEEERVPVLNPLEAFRQFYRTVRGEEMTEEAFHAMERIVQEAKEEGA